MCKSARPQYIYSRYVTLILFAGMGALASIRTFAQEPMDSDLWKSRCISLSAQSDTIDRGSAPPQLLETTRGIAGTKFAAVGQERGNAGQHYVACTMFYTAAMAEHMGNGGKVDTGRAHTDIVLAGAESKRAAGLPLSFKEKMDRTSGKLNPVGKGGLTPADLAAVYAAFEGGEAPPSGAPPSTSWGSGAQTPNVGGYNPNAPLPPSAPPGKRKDPPPTSPSQGSNPWLRRILS